MKRRDEKRPSEEPTFEYLVVEDEFNILDEVYDELFEAVEKEIKNTI